MVTPVVYSTPAFWMLENGDFENAADPFYFENSGVAFQCKRTKTESFKNDGVAAHIRSEYPWWPCKQ